MAGLSSGPVGRACNGSGVRAATLNKIAYVLGMSVRKLTAPTKTQSVVGESPIDANKPNKVVQNRRLRLEFAARLRLVIASKQTSPQNLSIVSGIPYSTISAWTRGASLPRVAMLKKLAESLGVTVRELTG